MKISLNWLKDYLDFDMDPQEISAILTEIGLEVGGMEAVETIKGGLKGIVVGEVLECGRHPNADKLSVTKVKLDDSDDEVQIVCGAPNVAKGQKVLVATVGTVLYGEDGEPWKIKKGKIRGEVSLGMICAEDELGLGQSHDGILVLPADTKVGTPAYDLYDTGSDIIYDIDLTPNRSDATSHFGTAEDLAAALKINYGHSGKVNKPSVADFKIENKDLAIDVEVLNNEACPRYSGVCISGLKVGPSPEWLQNKLKSVGLAPLNNVIDVTNFVLHELGQPLHAFDYDKIGGKKISVNTLAQGTKFTLLDDKEIELNDTDLMINDGQNKGMCMAGVYGGSFSGVSDATTQIFLESAYFDAGWIRKSSTKHLLRTDAAKCFEKGSNPNLTIFALKRAALLLKEIAGGVISSEIVDIYPTVIEPKEIKMSFAHLDRLVGTPIPPQVAENILLAMNMEIKAKDAESITALVPTNKADVIREADLIEEVLRIYGFNKVPLPTSLKSAISVGQSPDPYAVKNRIADHLSAQGYKEMMGVSLTQSRFYKEILPLEEKSLVYINNTSNRHLDIMRPDMLFSGLEAIQYNVNRQQFDIKFYEFGRSYLNTEDDYVEIEHMSLFLSGKNQGESWLEKQSKVSFSHLKGIVDNTLRRLGIESFQSEDLQNETFSQASHYFRGRMSIVSFGKVNTNILSKMDIKQEVFYADFNWENILKSIKKNKITYTPVTKFPTMRRDLALVVDRSVKYSDVCMIAAKAGRKTLKTTNLFDVFEDENKLGKGKKSYAVSFLFEDVEKTLKDKDVDKIMNKIISECENNLGALIRR